MPKAKRKSRSTPRRPTPTQFLRLVKQRRWVTVVVVLLVGGLAILADRNGWLLQEGGDWARYHGKTVRVVKVIDGDTLDVDLPDGDSPTTRIRFWGIDSPEMARRDKNLPAQPFAEEATKFTRELALNQQVTLRLESHRMRGNYGRVLAYIDLPDGSMLNERLLAAGLAKADQRFSHRLNERFTFIEKQARHDRAGLWAK